MESNRKVTIRYMITGICIGLLFPIVSYVILFIETRLPFQLSSLVEIHSAFPIQWIINSAPLVLAIFSYFAGRKQAQILKLNAELNATIHERETLIDQQEKMGENLKQEVASAVTHLRTAAEIAQTANTTRDLTQLLTKAVELISNQLGFYHVGIFLNDKSNQFAILQAANSEGGKRMLNRGHRLRIGEVGIVGYVAEKGEARIALDVEEDAAYFDNPDLPETHSEMALPLKASGATIGVLDIQSIERQAFDENDITVFQIIADSLSSTVEIVRLFQEEQAHLEEIENLHRQYLQKAWHETLAAQGPLEFTYHSDVDYIDENTEHPSRRAMRTIELPITLRGQHIGYLTLEADPRSDFGIEPMEWLPEELALMETVTNQVAQSLESFRLIDEAQRLVEQERFTSDFSEKVWSFSNIDTILRTALHELGTSLGAKDGMVEIEIKE